MAGVGDGGRNGANSYLQQKNYPTVDVVEFLLVDVVKSSSCNSVPEIFPKGMEAPPKGHGGPGVVGHVRAAHGAHPRSSGAMRGRRSGTSRHAARSTEKYQLRHRAGVRGHLAGHLHTTYLQVSGLQSTPTRQEARQVYYKYQSLRVGEEFHNSPWYQDEY